VVKRVCAILIAICSQPILAADPAQPSTPPIVAPGAQPAAAQVRAPINDDDPIIARLDKVTITRSQVVRPLLDGYGLNVLLNIATLQLAEDEAALRKIDVSSADIDKERDTTLSQMFESAGKEDYPNLLEQFLAQKHISRPEFDLWIQTNCYLRKIAEPMVKQSITEERLMESFKALYGEKVVVRHIQCANLQDIAEAKRLLAAGETFDAVARKLSVNPDTARLGGKLPPFSRYATGYPDVFKEAAFSLKVGEVSDSVQALGVYHLIKLEERQEPKVVKYEDVKEGLRKDLTERLTQSQVKLIRAQLVERIGKQLVVDDATLAKQYQDKKAQADTTVHGKKEALDAIKRDGARAAEQTPEPAPPALPEDLRPPATGPGAAPGTPTTNPSK